MTPLKEHCGVELILTAVFALLALSHADEDGGTMIIDHMGFQVSDLARSRDFFVAALKPLGMTITKQGEGWVMIGREREGDLWLGAFGAVTSPIHVAFSAKTREQVREFYAAALAAGGTDNGAPGIREQYHPNYYGAFVIAPDGHNIEAVCHKAE